MNEMLKRKNVIAIIMCIVVVIGVGGYLYWSNNQNEDDSIEALEEAEATTQKEENIVENITAEKSKEKIAIHVTGEVKKSGIVYLEKGARIIDAIKEAGGETKDANLDQVNLAYVLEDGQKIYIPNKKEKVEADKYINTNSGNNVLVEESKSSTSSTEAKGGSSSNTTNTKGANGKVNINSANQTELETLPGIGPALAQRIIEHRESNGNFSKIEDLQEVKGIGNSKYSNIKDKICI